MKPTMETDRIEGMKKYFNVKTVKDKNEFRCKKCKKGWVLPVTNNHPGNYLQLLNHAYSHEGKKKHPVQFE